MAVAELFLETEALMGKTSLTHLVESPRPAVMSQGACPECGERGVPQGTVAQLHACKHQ